jgi:hypothetical protein
MYLPDNWIREAESDSQHFFIDTTYFYPGELSLKRFTIDTSMFKAPTEWTQAYFIAYKLSVEYSVDPAGAVLYSNGDTSVKQGSLAAAEAYSVFFSSDTAIGSWAEYVRFTACGKHGYELYAIGDTADMSRNIGFYAALLQGIVLAQDDYIISPRAFRGNIARVEHALSPYLFDPLGREIRLLTVSRNFATGIYVRRNAVPRFLVR